MAKKQPDQMGKKDPFNSVSEQLKFFPDLNDESNRIFIGGYVASSELGDDPDPQKHIPVYKFADIATGEMFWIVQSYAIKKAVEAAKKEYGSLVDVIFRFEFVGKTVVNGKPFNQYNTGYCTREEYEESLK